MDVCPPETTIAVKGGSFLGYDPGVSATENPIANFIAEGYYAIEEDGYWTVEAISEVPGLE